MSYKKVFKFAISSILVISFAAAVLSAGIRRHDVKEEQYLDLAKQKQFDCVGHIFQDTIPGATCVLISDRYVLSAAHCFIDSDIRIDTLKIDGLTYYVNQPINERVTDITKCSFQFNGTKAKGKRLIMHPNFRDSLTKGTCDIAVIELAEPITNIIPAKLSTSFDELNSNVVGVGFGASGPANKPEKVDFHNLKIAGENTIDSLGDVQYNNLPSLMYCDFDHPKRKDCNRMGSPIPLPLEYLSTGGDSGGGLFRQNGNEWELIGIGPGGGTNVDVFRKTGYYGQIMEWRRVSVFADWIKEQMK
ncbi:MAG: trypsin-like serine protease [bacterium]